MVKLMKNYLTILFFGVAVSMANAQQDGQSKSMMGMNHEHMDHAAHMAEMAKAQRQSEVSARGKDVMPFDLSATLHVFTKSDDGGVQRVVARQAANTKEVKLTRAHLKDIQRQFIKGDFSGPSHIHGAQTPGLSELQASKPGQIAIEYKDVKGGAELSYRTSDPKLVVALHKWFDAQVSDHGKDAMEGHHHSH